MSKIFQKTLLIINALFLLGTVAAFIVFGRERLITGIFCGLFLAMFAFWLLSMGLHSIQQDSFSRMVRKYLLGALLIRLPVMAVIFSIALFWLEIHILGILAGLTIGIFGVSIIIFVQFMLLRKQNINRTLRG
ncbi:MAG: hypothetical protein A2487_20520 [Candidatus Raymondbacteria bacterium RifOxyC12_full_50_8]|uniref:Uncharacterized protein n=1 Tax=Candidatus Raymondbacteria bacterium RIFOXYD12_FULL_49_13 TaxID=1817890 RepID=A0A1F7F5H2_UNCRA|nr:MAG: hypothetical protein A2248_18790 [Candidatus Raymondbacteria bacterium RIFOXYA2_FULL_49_16]OGJ96479.1 MAG: hypothetical protein A2487_20520 [Candidatus Raymondbacteria bacterium RifOxyC12_full_50_8]OGJ99872.1 MAG: hypothetical protein A2350_18210 [Candidatus Raymondbacteria bacterium RifOxyB12_full_50_8]OGK01914.1 MAG: hypothetical protein A2519_05595 [Candidatus Raymondbacteria bacterium RIFOXYD12_FULL_49_13]OGP42608.1 MAG: hypothetical protein A2324_06495 [Candidatus Raymondbacteria b